MGTVNLLNASINGKLGELYGTKQFGKHYLKAIPFSHSPHNENQKKCVRSFEKLNRFSSGIAKVFFNYMGLQNKKMLKHNAVSKLFKPLIKNKTFDLNNISEIIKIDSSTTVVDVSIDFSKNLVSAIFHTDLEINKKNNSAWICFIMNSDGKILIADAPNEKEKMFSISAVLDESLNYIACAFRADKNNNKIILHGWATKFINIVIDGFLHIDLLENKSKWRVENNLLITTDENANIENNLLIIE